MGPYFEWAIMGWCIDFWHQNNADISVCGFDVKSNEAWLFWLSHFEFIQTWNPKWNSGVEMKGNDNTNLFNRKIAECHTALFSTSAEKDKSHKDPVPAIPMSIPRIPYIGQ